MHPSVFIKFIQPKNTSFVILKFLRNNLKQIFRHPTDPSFVNTTEHEISCFKLGFTQLQIGFSPCGNPMTVKIRSNWSWWYGLLVFISSWRQWNIGSEVSSSAKMQPIAQMSEETTIGTTYHHNIPNIKPNYCIKYKCQFSFHQNWLVELISLLCTQ